MDHTQNKSEVSTDKFFSGTFIPCVHAGEECPLFILRKQWELACVDSTDYYFISSHNFVSPVILLFTTRKDLQICGKLYNFWFPVSGYMAKNL